MELLLGILTSMFVAEAQPVPWHERNTDILRFEDGEVWPEVYYLNSTTSSSVTNRLLIHERTGIAVTVTVKVKSGTGERGPETITVTPTDPMVLVEPPGPQEVLDGEDIRIQVRPPLF